MWKTGDGAQAIYPSWWVTLAKRQRTEHELTCISKQERTTSNADYASCPVDTAQFSRDRETKTQEYSFKAVFLIAAYKGVKSVIQNQVLSG